MVFHTWVWLVVLLSFFREPTLLQQQAPMPGSSNLYGLRVLKFGAQPWPAMIRWTLMTWLVDLLLLLLQLPLWWTNPWKTSMVDFCHLVSGNQRLAINSDSTSKSRIPRSNLLLSVQALANVFTNIAETTRQFCLMLLHQMFAKVKRSTLTSMLEVLTLLMSLQKTNHPTAQFIWVNICLTLRISSKTLTVLEAGLMTPNTLWWPMVQAWTALIQKFCSLMVSPCKWRVLLTATLMKLIAGLFVFTQESRRSLTTLVTQPVVNQSRSLVCPSMVPTLKSLLVVFHVKSVSIN